jgi:hypothetical protein
VRLLQPGRRGRHGPALTPRAGTGRPGGGVHADDEQQQGEQQRADLVEAQVGQGHLHPQADAAEPDEGQDGGSAHGALQAVEQVAGEVGARQREPPYSSSCHGEAPAAVRASSGAPGTSSRRSPSTRAVVAPYGMPMARTPESGCRPSTVSSSSAQTSSWTARIVARTPRATTTVTARAATAHEDTAGEQRSGDAHDDGDRHAGDGVRRGEDGGLRHRGEEGRRQVGPQQLGHEARAPRRPRRWRRRRRRSRG